MDTKHIANTNLSVVVAKSVFGVCGVRQNFYEFSLYHNLDLDDQIIRCLPSSMAAVQAEEVRASFLTVSDMNGDHQEWFGSTTSNPDGVAGFDFEKLFGLVVCPTIARGGRLNSQLKIIGAV